MFRTLVRALFAGVVTEVALPLHGITPQLAADHTAAIIEEPKGGKEVNNEHEKSASATEISQIKHII